MKKYTVYIRLVLNASKDTNEPTPELQTDSYTVYARNEAAAIEKGKALDKSSLSVWDTYATEEEPTPFVMSKEELKAVGGLSVTEFNEKRALIRIQRLLDAANVEPVTAISDIMAEYWASKDRG